MKTTLRNLAVLIALVMMASPASTVWAGPGHPGHQGPGHHGPGLHNGHHGPGLHHSHHRHNGSWVHTAGYGSGRECWTIDRYVNDDGDEVIVRRCRDRFGNVRIIRIVRQ